MKPGEILPNLLMDGAWTRCEHCRNKFSQAQMLGNRVANVHHIDALLKKQALEHAANIEVGMGKLKCDVCQEEKTQSEYHFNMWKDKSVRKQIRCITCMRCPTCAPGTKHVLNDFTHGSKICNTCNRTLTCVVCKKAKPRSSYTDTVWNNQKTQKHHRCQACFTCTRCPAGKPHKMIDFAFGMPYCKRCDARTCNACEKTIEKDLCLTNRNSTLFYVCHARAGDARCENQDYTDVTNVERDLEHRFMTPNNYGISSCVRHPSFAKFV